MDSDDSLNPALEHGSSLLAQRIHDIDGELDLLRRRRPTLFGHLLQALLMVAILLVAWYRVVFDGYGDVLLYIMIGGVGGWCATIVIEVVEHRQRQLRLERELDTLLAKPVDRRSPRNGVGPSRQGVAEEQ